jgi:hypothetical protein
MFPYLHTTERVSPQEGGKEEAQLGDAEASLCDVEKRGSD